jgi:hypothetical protein
MSEQPEAKSEHDKKRTKIYSSDEVTLHGRVSIEESRPNTGIVVIASPEGHVIYPGTKCDHGGYIPSTHPDRDRAPYCSVCYPYLLTLNE